jgi:hypothetical protein
MAALTFPLACWLGLLDIDSGGEITQPSYARQPVTLVYCADGVTIANPAAVQWPIAHEDWGSVDAVEVWDAPVAGTLLVSLFTSDIEPVPQYAIARIPPAGVQMVQVAFQRGFGTGGFGTGGFGSGSGLSPVASGIPTPYGVGPYGVGPYGTDVQGVTVEVTFDTAAHVCAPGAWTPGFARAA